MVSSRSSNPVICLFISGPFPPHLTLLLKHTLVFPNFSLLIVTLVDLLLSGHSAMAQSPQSWTLTLVSADLLPSSCFSFPWFLNFPPQKPFQCMALMMTRLDPLQREHPCSIPFSSPAGLPHVWHSVIQVNEDQGYRAGRGRRWMRACILLLLFVLCAFFTTGPLHLRLPITTCLAKDTGMWEALSWTDVCFIETDVNL